MALFVSQPVASVLCNLAESSFPQVLEGLLNHPKAANFEITVLVRSQEKANKLTDDKNPINVHPAKVKALVGSTPEREKPKGKDEIIEDEKNRKALENAASEADVVIATVSAILPP